MPVEIAENIYWVGNYKETDYLHCNPYLLDFGEESILIDPGGVDDFSVVAQKILNIMEFSQIQSIILHHQDPDVCGMTHFLEDMIQHPIQVISHYNNEYFLRHYGIKSPITDISRQNYEMKLEKAGITLKFIYTPFLHSPGSFMTFIPEYKILFSSDLFGWVGFEDQWTLFDNNVEKSGYEEWHLQIVPHKKILKPVLEKIKELDIEMIAPQHGSILKGKDNIQRLFTRLEKINYSLKEILGE
jgi:flavorubredoxin